ncbi:uncharacterized protein PAC_05302 [Phialocephala subalpina]|uniref:Uncharacterized protein n=1 Tax=Phialocephala subalpina TaxID=576137 RepID=A0A1L7WRP8_9HELO|nr:uncharacterized protein PAC_05302 [Phialocephala subalpina]
MTQSAAQKPVPKHWEYAVRASLQAEESQAALQVLKSKTSKTKKRKQEWYRKNKQSKGIEDKPFPFMELPYDIRHMIYKLCFAREICIVPARNYYQCRAHKKRGTPELCLNGPYGAISHDPNHLTKRDDYCGGGWIKYSVYKYQWSGNLQTLPQFGDWTLLSRDDGLLEPEADEWDYYISGFFSVKILRTYKKLREEGTEVLYGCNSFDFNTVWPQYAQLLDNDRIPSVPDEGSANPSPKQISAAVDNIFDKRCHQPPFHDQDPFIKFLTKIGRHNAGLIKSIKLNGAFKTLTMEDGSHDGPSLAQTLPIYTLIPNNACQNLRKVTLQASMGTKPWPEGYREGLEANDEQIVGDVTGKFVEGLPQLKQLCLGSHEILHEKQLSPTYVEDQKEADRQDPKEGNGDDLHLRDHSHKQRENAKGADVEE